MSRTRIAAVLALAGLAVAGCSSTGGLSDLGWTQAPTAPGEEETTAPAPGGGSTVQCDDPTQSYPALDFLPGPDALPSGSTMQEIRDRGSLIAGVSADTLLMGARNPFTGALEGFDVDMLRKVSTAIFGSPDHIQFRVITSADRVPLLESGEVDIVARTFSMTCARWESLAFSTEYYQAGQKVLVGADSTATGLDDLSGKKVCAPEATTTLTRLEDFPEIEAVSAVTHTACLVLFQQGKVDAITGDDTILAGFVAQDPYAKVVGEAISAEHYGLGIPADNVDMVAFVNRVIADSIADGSWNTSYQKWLGVLGDTPLVPVPNYGRAG